MLNCPKVLITMCMGSSFFKSLSTLGLLVLDFSHSSGYVVVSHDFNLHLLMTNDTGSL